MLRYIYLNLMTKRVVNLGEYSHVGLANTKTNNSLGTILSFHFIKQHMVGEKNYHD